MMKERAYYAALRLNGKQKEYFYDPCTFANDPSETKRRAAEVNQRFTPGWATENPVVRIEEVTVDRKPRGARFFVIEIPEPAYWCLSEKGYIASVRGHAGIERERMEAEAAFRAPIEFSNGSVKLSSTLAGLRILRSWFEEIKSQSTENGIYAQVVENLRKIENEVSRRKGDK